MTEKRSLPINELDMQFRTIETVWNEGPINPEVRAALSRLGYQLDKDGNVVRGEDGEPVIVGRDYSKILKLQTRDLRISNLDGASYQETVWYHKFGADAALLGDLPQSVALCVDHRDSILNIRQSVKGWKAELMNTLIQHSHFREEQPGKKKLLSTDKDRGGT